MIRGDKQQNNIAKLEEWKAFVNIIGNKGANFEDIFLFHFLFLSVLPRLREGP